MINKAIEKLTNEMMRNGSNAFRMIEEYLTNICTNDEVAEKILKEGKTIAGAYDAMSAEARKLACGKSQIALSDEEGFDIVLKYYDIKSKSYPSKKELIDVIDLI